MTRKSIKESTPETQAAWNRGTAEGSDYMAGSMLASSERMELERNEAISMLEAERQRRRRIEDAAEILLARMKSPAWEFAKSREAAIAALRESLNSRS